MNAALSFTKLKCLFIISAAAGTPSVICLSWTQCNKTAPVVCMLYLQWSLIRQRSNDELYCLNRWSSIAQSHPTWHSPRRHRSSASGQTAGPTPCSDWASLQSSSWQRWEGRFLYQHMETVHSVLLAEHYMKKMRQSEEDLREYLISRQLAQWIFKSFKDEPVSAWVPF